MENVLTTLSSVEDVRFDQFDDEELSKEGKEEEEEEETMPLPQERVVECYTIIYIWE